MLLLLYLWKNSRTAPCAIQRFFFTKCPPTTSRAWLSVAVSESFSFRTFPLINCTFRIFLISSSLCLFMDYNNKYKKFPAARQAMALQIRDRWMMDYLLVRVLLRISRSFGTQLFIELNIYFTSLFKLKKGQQLNLLVCPAISHGPKLSSSFTKRLKLCEFIIICLSTQSCRPIVRVSGTPEFFLLSQSSCGRG